MQTSAELLQGILHVVTRIDQRMAKDTTQSNNAKSGIGSIVGKIKNFGKPKDKKKQGITDGAQLITDLLSSQNIDDKKLGVISANIGTISDSLPNLVAGMNELANLKTKKVRQGINTVEFLFNAFNNLGDPKTSRNIDRSTKSLTTMGFALLSVARPLNKISNFFIKLGIGIAAFAGSLWLAGKLFGTTPLGAIIVVGAIIAGMVGAFWLISKADKAVAKGVAVAGGMGLAMATLSLGIIAFAITLVAVPAILGISGGGIMAVGLGLLTIVGTIAAMVGIFSLLGAAGALVGPGVAVAAGMAAGMALLSLGVIAMVIAAKAITAIDSVPVDNEQEGMFGMTGVMSGLGTMGVVLLGAAAFFSLLGVASPVLLPGLGVGVLMAGSMILTALAVKKLMDITSTMKMGDVQSSITGLLSSTLLGFADGVSQGLLGKDSADSGFFSQLGTAYKNTVAITSGIALISGVSLSLSLFAMSLRAFESIGTIKPITGYAADGTPQFGKPVGVLGVSKNIANSISTFFTTLSTLFGPGGGMPEEQDIEKITNMLMGKGGLRIFGFDVLRSGPNLMDALMSFGEVLNVWGAMASQGEISVGTNADGTPKKGPKTVMVAGFIGDTIGTFMRTLVNYLTDDKGKMPDMDELAKITDVLMGTGGLRLFGFDVARTKPNLMEALMSFGDVLTYWGKFGEKGEVPTEFDDKGKAIKGIKLTTVAHNIASAIGGFMKSLTTEIPQIGKDLQPQIALMAKILLGEQASSLWKFLGVSSDVPGILEPVSKFADVIKQFASGKIQTGEFDADGNPIYESVNYQKTAKNIVKAISEFTISLSGGLKGLASSNTDYENNALDAGKFIGKFESMFSKLEMLSSSSSGLDRLAGSLSNVGAGIGEIADNLERMDAEKLERAVRSVGDYEVKTQNIPTKQTTAAKTSPGTSGGTAMDSVDWDNVSILIGAQVGQEVSNALRRGQFRFEFDTTKSGGSYYWEPAD